MKMIKNTGFICSETQTFYFNFVGLFILLFIPYILKRNNMGNEKKEHTCENLKEILFLFKKLTFKIHRSYP